MEVITKKEFLEKREYAEKIRKGELFVYPTDTIYGIGCSALNEKSILHLREIKNQHTRPFSIIVPSKQWIFDNCEVSPTVQKWINKLPGPYTLILKLKTQAIPKPLNLDSGTIGVRIPAHWISNYVSNLNLPIITTSVNKAGGRFMLDLEDIDEYIKANVSFLVYEGKKISRPSTLVDLSQGYAVIKRR